MKKSALLPLTIIFLFGCKSDPSAPANNAGIIPLNIGNTWVYKVSRLLPDSLGGETSGNVTIRIEKDTSVDGSIWYIVPDVFHPNPNFQTNSSQGLMEFFIQNTLPTSASPKTLKYKFPCSAGDRYDITIDKWPDSTQPTRSYWENLSTNELITVQGKQYITYHYQFIFENYNASTSIILSRDTAYSAYLEPSIGLIKAVQTTGKIVYHQKPDSLITIPEIFTAELSSYKKAGSPSRLSTVNCKLLTVSFP